MAKTALHKNAWTVGGLFISAGVCICAPLASGADAGDYVQRGLVAHWDALENAGAGVHDANATTWVDLTGNGFDWTMQDASLYSWSERGLEMLGKDCVAKLAHHNKTNFFGKIVTIECVYAHNKAGTSGYILDSGYATDGGDGKYPLTLTWWKASGVEQFGVWVPMSSTRYGFTSAIGVTNTYTAVYTCTGETPPTGVKTACAIWGRTPRRCCRADFGSTLRARS